ncbi:MAG: GTPase Era [Spirochaetaceae bacterium]|jgi:GTP-binding protein Era|nr:GTPase Era [Spirochaetaceae bacterium]
MEKIEKTAKSAFVAVIGRPSVGKSTLVNLFCGGNVAIVSPVPQTTRNAIRGIVNREAGQLVFVDTPGRHLSDKKFNKGLTKTSDRVLAESDLVLYVLDASREPGPEEEAITAALAALPEDTLHDKTIAAINKADMPKADGAPITAFLREKLPAIRPEHILTVSALQKQNTDALLVLLFEKAPEGEAWYPAEYYTDQEVPFRIAEIIRGAAISRLREELPHAIFVNIEDIALKNDGKTLYVRAAICVERESQKGMVVGKGGAMLGRIREAAQKQLDAVFDWKVKLDIRVKTVKDWRSDDRILKKLRNG